MHVQDRASELDPVIAATAIVHGTVVLNRKLVDQEASGVPLLSLWLP